MLLLCIAIVVLRLLIVIIYKYLFYIRDRFILIFDKLEYYLFLLIKKFYLQVLIDFYLLGVIKLLKALTIDYTTYLISNLYSGGLQLTTLANGLNIAYNIS